MFKIMVGVVAISGGLIVAEEYIPTEAFGYNDCPDNKHSFVEHFVFIAADSIKVTVSLIEVQLE
jgi:hypothetical protein